MSQCWPTRLQAILLSLRLRRHCISETSRFHLLVMSEVVHHKFILTRRVSAAASMLASVLSVQNVAQSTWQDKLRAGAANALTTGISRVISTVNSVSSQRRSAAAANNQDIHFVVQLTQPCGITFKDDAIKKIQIPGGAATWNQRVSDEQHRIVVGMIVRSVGTCAIGVGQLAPALDRKVSQLIAKCGSVVQLGLFDPQSKLPTMSTETVSTTLADVPSQHQTVVEQTQPVLQSQEVITWQTVSDPSSGRNYYVNMTTLEVQWDRPSAGNVMPLAP